jgi:hypothetical protein
LTEYCDVEIECPRGDVAVQGGYDFRERVSEKTYESPPDFTTNGPIEDLTVLNDSLSPGLNTYRFVGHYPGTRHITVRAYVVCRSEV